MKLPSYLKNAGKGLKAASQKTPTKLIFNPKAPTPSHSDKMILSQKSKALITFFLGYFVKILQAGYTQHRSIKQFVIGSLIAC